MFESPLRPAPLKEVQGGAPDPFAGRPQTAPMQAAPEGEFTKIFGTRDLPPAAKPIATPTPRPAGGASATNAFQVPAPGEAPGPMIGGGFNSSGPPASIGSTEYTTMMSQSSGGLLAQAAAAQPEEEKSFFQKNKALILIGAAFLLFFIIILVVFAMRK
jgi:hypothetical protein